MIQIEKLKKSYSNRTVLEINSLSIQRNQIVGLVGNNGAGKTTFLRLMLNLIEADSGSIEINTINIFKSEKIKMSGKVCSFIDETFLLSFLSPLEFFDLIGQLYKIPKDDLTNRLKDLNQFATDELMDHKKLIRELSQGNRHKTGLVAAMLPQPELLILDEPFAHLDPSSQIILQDRLKILNQEYNTTILLSSHNLTHVGDICDRILLIDHGQILQDKHNTPSVLRDLEKYFIEQTQD